MLKIITSLEKHWANVFEKKMIEIVVTFHLNMIFGQEKGAKIRHFGAKNFLICHEFYPSFEDLYSMKCLIHVNFKSLGSDKYSDI